MSKLVAAGDVAARRIRRLAVGNEGGGRLEDAVAVWAFRGKGAVCGEDVLLEVDGGREVGSVSW